MDRSSSRNAYKSGDISALGGDPVDRAKAHRKREALAKRRALGLLDNTSTNKYYASQRLPPATTAKKATEASEPPHPVFDVTDKDDVYDAVTSTIAHLQDGAAKVVVRVAAKSLVRDMMNALDLAVARAAISAEQRKLVVLAKLEDGALTAVDPIFDAPLPAAPEESIDDPRKFIESEPPVDERAAPVEPNVVDDDMDIDFGDDDVASGGAPDETPVAANTAEAEVAPSEPAAKPAAEEDPF